MININKNISFKYNSKPIIIAEISGNHNGNKKRFLSLIKSAFKNGADIVKIQTYEPSDITLNIKKKKFKIKNGIWKNKYLWNLYERAHTPYRWHYDAFKIARKYKKIIFSTPFSKKGVDFLEKLNVPIYKIASFEITDLCLIDYIASKKKPIIISTGLSTIYEIKNAIKVINKYHKKIIILHCVSNYPTAIEDSNLSKITELKKIFKKYYIGLSDHTNDIYTSIASQQLGVVAIEKHYNLDNKKTTDSDFSINPKKLLKLSNIVSKLSIKKKSKINKISQKLRRSLFTTSVIKKNQIFKKTNIAAFRPMVGICASNYFKVIGKKAKKDMALHQPITKNDIL